jgi:ABC-2 type transport system ATP-binding protein
MSSDAIRIEVLTKRFKEVQALRGLSLRVPRGSLCGFLGRNGAGKTTTLKILLGMARKDSGSVEALGFDAATRAGSLAIRGRTAFVSENKELYPYMTVSEAIYFVRKFFPGWRIDIEKRYLKLFELPPDQKIAKLSKGMQTKLMLLLAIARGAELLLLDEPTDGLDPAVSEEALQAIVSVAAEQEVTVFFSSHHLAEIEQIADRVCIIEAGRTVLSEQLDDLRANYRMVQSVFENDAPSSLTSPGVERIEAAGRSVCMLVGHDVNEVVRQVRARGAVSVDVRPVTLKEIFIGAVKGVRA